MTNPNHSDTICFIVCVNEERLYGLCLGHIRELYVPPGMKVEVLPVRGAASMTAGYNWAMQQSKAAYKVYLHQDTFILNKQFIEELLSHFRSDPKLGLLGVAGAARMPANGIWWEDVACCGKVLELRTLYRRLNFAEVLEVNRTVEVVDGLLMATQYDLPWREDLFDGWHFYDASQCAEFARQGLRAVIPRQPEHWVLHVCGNEFDNVAYDHYRQIYIKEYRPE